VLAGVRDAVARSGLPIRSPSLGLDDTMAPKYHPAPPSGRDRKALNKELGKARAMANFLAYKFLADTAKMIAIHKCLSDCAAADRTAVGWLLRAIIKSHKVPTNPH
jgi:hypothetical protein